MSQAERCLAMNDMISFLFHFSLEITCHGKAKLKLQAGGLAWKINGTARPCLTRGETPEGRQEPHVLWMALPGDPGVPKGFGCRGLKMKTDEEMK